MGQTCISSPPAIANEVKFTVYPSVFDQHYELYSSALSLTTFITFIIGVMQLMQALFRLRLGDQSAFHHFWVRSLVPNLSGISSLTLINVRTFSTSVSGFHRESTRQECNDIHDEGEKKTSNSNQRHMQESSKTSVGSGCKEKNRIREVLGSAE